MTAGVILLVECFTDTVMGFPLLFFLSFFLCSGSLNTEHCNYVDQISHSLILEIAKFYNSLFTPRNFLFLFLTSSKHGEGTEKGTSFG